MARDQHRRTPALLALLRVLAVLLIVSSRLDGTEAMVFPAADWVEATPESRGVNPKRLSEAVAYLKENSGPDGVRELVIIRHGRLIWKGSDIDKVHGVWSMTKSFTSSVLGLLIDAGKCTLDSPVKTFAPEMAASYGTVTLRHFTTMTSGYRAVGDEPRGGYTHGPSPTPFTPASKPLFPPGTRYAYWDSAMNQFGNILTGIAGESIEELFKQRLADPIGMDRKYWDWGDFGARNGVTINGGSGNSNKHVKISARQVARFGHLFLNGGAWNGRQLISKAWVEAATRVQVPSSMPLGHRDSGIDGRGVYGFNWWTNGTGPDGSRKWAGAPPGTFAASGYNNNDMFVVPEWGMVIARLGLDQSRKKIAAAVYSTFLEKIGAAIHIDTGLEGWRLESSRDDIAPAAWLDEIVRFENSPTLALAGRNRPSVNGHWTCSVPVSEGMHYRFETHFRSVDIDEPERSILARVNWRDDRGKLLMRPEYPATVALDAPTRWGTIRHIYQAPPRATHAILELVLRWDDDGQVHFGGTRFDRVKQPAPRKVRLASIHHRPRRSKGPRDNLEAFARFIALAAKEDADIVCLPEGITVVGTGKTYIDVSEPVPGPTTRFLGEQALHLDLAIVAGIYERAGTVVYNTAVLIDRKGKLAGKYRKVCLPREEIDGGVTPGDSFPVFDTEFGRIGMMICWDVFFPEPARMLSRQGAEVIFLPIWGGNLDLARARAIENQIYLVSSTYDMKTAVFDPTGAILEEGSEEKPVIVVEVDLNKRTLWPWLGDFKSRIPRERPPEKAMHIEPIKSSTTSTENRP